ncbi:MAG TPA: radical SAM protein [Candidatus Sabulitectum sp.]|nr:radical SAM protein [Candidatus Sabulitectum sp.]
MSRKSASDKYEERRCELLDAERRLSSGNSEGVFETLVAFPREYSQAMGHLAFHRLYKQLSTWPDTVCARAFLPEKDELNWRKRQNRPVETLDTGKSIKDSDLLVFLMPSETDWFNALEMMDLSGITLENRKREHKWPILLATGMSVTANPIPMSGFFDAFIIGETEPTLGPVLDIIKSLGSRRRPKAEILKGLSYLPGLYVPTVHGTDPRSSIMRQWASSESVGALTDTISAHSIMPDTYILEIARGCPFNCRFCMSGYLLLPYREQRAEDLEEKINGIPEGTTVVYTACTPGGHDELKQLMKLADKAGLNARISSHMRETPELAEELPTIMDADTLLMVPETGSESLRKVLGKYRNNESYFNTVRNMPQGMKAVQINFQLGFPFENDNDRRENVEFVEAIMGLTKLPITVRVDQFIPRPWTAFQWSPMAGLREVREHLTELKAALKKLGVKKIKGFDPRDTHIQALLIRGDRRVGKALMKKLEGVGWNTAFEYAEMDMNSVFVPMDQSKQLPWEFLNMGFGYTRLAREYQMAQAAQEERMGNPVTTEIPDDD